jgi:hypothetical protein
MKQHGTEGSNGYILKNMYLFIQALPLIRIQIFFLRNGT